MWELAKNLSGNIEGLGIIETCSGHFFFLKKIKTHSLCGCWCGINKFTASCANCHPYLSSLNLNLHNHNNDFFNFIFSNNI